MPDYKAEYQKLAERQKELQDKLNTPDGLTAEEQDELQETIVKKSSLQEHVWDS